MPNGCILKLSLLFFYTYKYITQDACRPESSAIYNWPQKIYQKSVQTLLKITLLPSRKSYLVIILAKFIWKVDQKWNQVNLESVQTLLKIIHPASWKSYLVIIGPNSNEKLTKMEIRSILIQFEYCL